MLRLPINLCQDLPAKNQTQPYFTGLCCSFLSLLIGQEVSDPFLWDKGGQLGGAVVTPSAGEPALAPRYPEEMAKLMLVHEGSAQAGCEPSSCTVTLSCRDHAVPFPHPTPPLSALHLTQLFSLHGG